MRSAWSTVRQALSYIIIFWKAWSVLTRFNCSRVLLFMAQLSFKCPAKKYSKYELIANNRSTNFWRSKVYSPTKWWCVNEIKQNPKTIKLNRKGCQIVSTYCTRTAWTQKNSNEITWGAYGKSFSCFTINCWILAQCITNKMFHRYSATVAKKERCQWKVNRKELCAQSRTEFFQQRFNQAL